MVGPIRHRRLGAGSGLDRELVWAVELVWSERGYSPRAFDLSLTRK